MPKIRKITRKITLRPSPVTVTEAIELSKQRYRTGRDSLTSEQVDQLIASFDLAWEKALIHLAVAAGLRRVDIVNLKRRDFDPATGSLTYYEKKKHRTRTIMIPSAAAIQSVKIHLNSCRKSEWLFPSPLLGPNYEKAHVSDKQAYDMFNEHLDLVKIRRRPFHSLRATCIKLCENAGWSSTETAELVGDTVRVIQEHYSTPSDEQMAAVATTKPIV